MRTRPLAVGSVAYDVVFDVHNTFRDEVLLDEKQVLKSFNMMLTAKNKKVFFGGTAGNIAYGLGSQGHKPLLFSVVGDDFALDYKAHLESHDVDLRLVEKPGEFTATFYAISDQEKEQLGIFQPNTHGDYMGTIKLDSKLTPEDFAAIKVAIFSPGTGKSILNHMQQFRKHAGKEPVVIFDPSQVLSIFFTPAELQKCLELADIFIGNETEVAQLTTILGMTVANLLDAGLDYVIETLGERGSLVHSRRGREKIPPQKVRRYVEQTGAGDAYRAGFIAGLLQDRPIAECCKLGARLGALNVQTEGGQRYRLDN